MGQIVLLHHGTTRDRAEALLQQGPDCNYDEPNGGGRPEGFFAAPAEGPFSCGDPRSYAHRKVAALRKANLPDEGGPAILEFELPPDLAKRIISAAGERREEKAFNAGGVICFEWGGGLEQLCASWSSLAKRIILLESD